MRVRLLLATALAAFAALAEENPAGARLYRRHCAACHGEQAQGLGRAPALRTAAIREAPPEALYRILTNGIVRRGMPSWSQLPPERRRQIVAYLKSLR